MITKYFHKQTVSMLAIAVTVFFSLAPANSSGGEIDPPDTTVQHLLDYVARSNLVFIRNSDQYTAKEASEHMKSKYDHFRDKIKTPEEFIKLCATRSLLSGKPYLVISEHGETVRTSEWLSAELEAYRNSTAAEFH